MTAKQPLKRILLIISLVSILNVALNTGMVKSATNEVELGTPVDLGTFTITFDRVWSIPEITQSSNYGHYALSDGYKYVIVDFRTKNTAKTAISASWPFKKMVLHDDEGYSYQPISYIYDLNLRVEEEKSGWIIYQILERTKPAKLTLDDISLNLRTLTYSASYTATVNTGFDINFTGTLHIGDETYPAGGEGFILFNLGDFPSNARIQAIVLKLGRESAVYKPSSVITAFYIWDFNLTEGPSIEYSEPCRMGDVEVSGTTNKWYYWGYLPVPEQAKTYDTQKASLVRKLAIWLVQEGAGEVVGFEPNLAELEISYSYVPPPSLVVSIVCDPATLTSYENSASVKVYVTDGSVPIQGATVELVSMGGGDFTQRSGETDSNGYFTTTLVATTVTTQTVIVITATATKTGYASQYSQIQVTENPSQTQPDLTLWRYITILIIVFVLVAIIIAVAGRKSKRVPSSDVIQAPKSEVRRTVSSDLKVPPPYTPKSYLKRCVECNREIPLASEECPYCNASQEG